jgi:transcriptional regulator with XRE-family HTH domain
MASLTDSAWEMPASILGWRADAQAARRRTLGNQLRRLRESRGLSVSQAAEAIRGSHSKISRLEKGTVGLKERDLDDLLTLYGVIDADERAAILNLASEARTPGWWQAYSDVMPAWLKPYAGLEAAASALCCYEVQSVPGLLQTPDYALALIAQGGAASDEEITRRAELRIRRQQILQGPNPARLRAIVDESALRRLAGGREVARGQLRHLIEMTGHPAVTVQLLPFSAGAHRAMGGPFTVLSFAEPDLNDIVYLEQLTSALYLDKKADVTYYHQVIEQLGLAAEPAGDTAKLLDDILAQT